MYQTTLRDQSEKCVTRLFRNRERELSRFALIGCLRTPYSYGPSGSRFMAPLRCLRRISTLFSASASCCLHRSASFAPSSNSFTDSSRETSPRSICATIASSCLRDSSKFCNGRSFNFFFLRRIEHTGDNVGSQGVTCQRRAHLHALNHSAYRGEHLLRNADPFGSCQLWR